MYCPRCVTVTVLRIENSPDKRKTEGTDLGAKDTTTQKKKVARPAPVPLGAFFARRGSMIWKSEEEAHTKRRKKLDEIIQCEAEAMERAREYVYRFYVVQEEEIAAGVAGET